MRRKGVEAELTVWLPLVLMIFFVMLSVGILAFHNFTENMIENPFSAGDSQNYIERISDQRNLRITTTLPHVLLNREGDERKIKSQIQRHLMCKASGTCDPETQSLNDTVRENLQPRQFSMELRYVNASTEFATGEALFRKGAIEFNVPMPMPGVPGQFVLLASGVTGSVRWEP
jgi:hypothetical protein